MTIAVQLTRLTSRLSRAEEKYIDAQTEYNQIRDEINALLGNSRTGLAHTKASRTRATNAKTTKPAMKKTTRNTGPKLGDKIEAYLQTNPGKDRDAIADRFDIDTRQAGLAIGHLTRKGKVFQQDGGYYVAIPMAAKTTPVPYITPDDDDDEGGDDPNGNL